MHDPHTRLILIALTVVGVSSLACTSTQTGKAGELEFTYVTDDDVRDFNKAIAVGARLDLEVRESGNQPYAERQVTLNEATSSDEGVFEIVNVSGDRFTIEGVGVGTAELRVDATTVDSGEGLIDAVDMRTAVPEVLKLQHSCGDNPAGRVGKYLVDQVVLIPFEMELSDGQPVIGYGYYPVTHEPAAALEPVPDTKAQAFIHYTTAETPQQVTLTSDIDSATLTLDLVDPGDIDGATLTVSPTLREGRTELFYVLPTVGADPVCQANTPVAFEVTTPDVCSVREASAPVTEEARQYGWFSITGIAEGQCLINVSYAAGAAGAGSTTEISVGVNAP
jgi:hypothetical protein